jgi:hypothetical protein
MFCFERCNFHGLYNSVRLPGPGKEIMIGVALTGVLVDHTGSYASAFCITAGIYFFGLLFYLAFGTGKKII